MVLSRDRKKLHWVAAGKQSDWDGVPNSKRNPWQKVADATHGLVTVGNAASFLGFYLVVVGLYNFAAGDMISGVVQVIAGRCLDYLDGILADMTKTKSFVGATVDATLDTFELVLALVVLIEVDAIPAGAAAIIIVPKLFNALGYITAKYIRGKHVNTTAQSKIATAFLWASIATFMTAELFSDISTLPIAYLGWALMVGAVALTVPSTIEYMQLGFTGKKQKA